VDDVLSTSLIKKEKEKAWARGLGFA